MPGLPIQFPLVLQPVVRSRDRGLRDGAPLPYHPAILIVDAAGHRVVDIAPDADDIRAGRVISDPHRLVSRATRVAAWLKDVHGRISAWVDALDGPDDLIVRAVISVNPPDNRVKAGVKFCSAPGEEFDEVTNTLSLLAGEDELMKNLDPLRDLIRRRHDSALSILAALQEAVHSWRSTEALTAADEPPLAIDDSTLEH